MDSMMGKILYRRINATASCSPSFEYVETSLLCIQPGVTTTGLELLCDAPVSETYLSCANEALPEKRKHKPDHT